MINKAKIRTMINWVDLIQGMYVFNRTGKTPNKAYQAMIRLHGQTGGFSTNWITNRYRDLSQEQAIAACSGILGNLTVSEMNRINNQLKSDGYYVLEQVVPEKICDQITTFALTVPALIETNDHKNNEGYAIFDPDNPISKTYKVPENELINNVTIQELMADPSLYAIAKAYLRAEPVLTSVNTWFSPVFKPDVTGEASAQSYHFDMPNCRWIKFFLYLNDVEKHNGPHCFIKKSHHQFKKAKRLLKRGYVRIPDEDIYNTFGKENEVEFIAKKGTVIIEDTMGFHKGMIPRQGYRSIFEMSFAINLFGNEYQQYPIKLHSPQLREAIKHKAPTYQRYQCET
ncbi:MAG: phytanoyl-CoA dioxygenase family protein [Proteobacteria bacterium]|nr:phytanoyl-CoA dioxygenase family protein [Pseudomonadota bacterium]